MPIPQLYYYHYISAPCMQLIFLIPGCVGSHLFYNLNLAIFFLSVCIFPWFTTLLCLFNGVHDLPIQTVSIKNLCSLYNMNSCPFNICQAQAIPTWFSIQVVLQVIVLSPFFKCLVYYRCTYILRGLGMEIYVPFLYFEILHAFLLH